MKGITVWKVSWQEPVRPSVRPDPAHGSRAVVRKTRRFVAAYVAVRNWGDARPGVVRTHRSHPDLLQAYCLGGRRDYSCESLL